MILSTKTLEKLRNLINEETERRTGRQLVDFFNSLGEKDIYGMGFPSRWIYTDEKLQKINGTPTLDKCIQTLFQPINYVGRYSDLDRFIDDFNLYLSYDGWNVVRDGTLITFKHVDEPNIDYLKSKESVPDNSEDVFLKTDYTIDIEGIGIENSLRQVISSRLKEIEICINGDAPLAAIFLCGSTLEGIMLNLALSHTKLFNCSNCAPKKDGQVKQFHEWTLNNYIDVCYDLGFVKEDVKKFSVCLRDFRNYIHPYQQMNTRFNPDKNTAVICFHVLKAAVCQMSSKHV